MRVVLLGTVVGVVAFLVAWSLWHLWIDHQNLHALLNWANQQAQTAAKTK